MSGKPTNALTRRRPRARPADVCKPCFQSSARRVRIPATTRTMAASSLTSAVSVTTARPSPSRRQSPTALDPHRITFPLSTRRTMMGCPLPSARSMLSLNRSKAGDAQADSCRLVHFEGHSWAGSSSTAGLAPSKTLSRWRKVSSACPTVDDTACGAGSPLAQAGTARRAPVGPPAHSGVQPGGRAGAGRLTRGGLMSAPQRSASLDASPSHASAKTPADADTGRAQAVDPAPGEDLTLIYVWAEQCSTHARDCEGPAFAVNVYERNIAGKVGLESAPLRMLSRMSVHRRHLEKPEKQDEGTCRTTYAVSLIEVIQETQAATVLHLAEILALVRNDFIENQVAR